MPDLSNRTEWVLRLNDDDFLLILKCLGGRIGDVEERAACELLGDRLTDLKANRLAFLGEQAAALKAALVEKGYERPTLRLRRPAVDTALEAADER